MTREQIAQTKLFNPGLIDGELMKFLLASPGEYFVKRVSDDSYMKSGKGGFLKIPLAKVIDARLDYLSEQPENLETEIEAAIEKERQRLGKGLAEKAMSIRKLIAEKHQWATDTGGIFHQVLRQERPQEAIWNKQNAEDFFVQFPNALEFSEQLGELLLNEDYEGLHHALGETSEPLAVFNLNSTVLKKLFAASVVEDTITDLKEKGAVYLMAKVNVEKRYYPD